MLSSTPFSKPGEVRIRPFSTGANEAREIAVIIDVFRAFTVAAIALANGAKQIIMVDDLTKAIELRNQNRGQYCIGERRGIKPKEFNFGNSPAELGNVQFKGETLIQTTSNGTRGILAASNAQVIYAASLVTAEATVKAIENSPCQSVTLVPMGDKDFIQTDEDEICALYMRSRLQGRHPDIGAIRQVIETMSSRMDSQTLSADDVDCCLQVNSVALAIRVELFDGLYVATAEYPYSTNTGF